MNQIGIPESIFTEIYSSYLCDFTDGRSYKYYCDLYHYDNPEQLRSLFRRGRKARNLPSKHDIVNIVHNDDTKNDTIEIVNKYQKFMDGRKLPKIVLFDLETLPIKCMSWSLYDAFIPHEFIIEDWALLGWSAKELYSAEVKSDILTSDEAVTRNDKRITESLWKVMDGADIIIGHNSKGFDVPSARTRFLHHRLSPPSFFQVVDTLEISRKMFRNSSNKLDALCGSLNLNKKRKTDINLWVRCDHGDTDALKEMQTYNKNDVNILEDYYVLVRPWFTTHPNLGLYGEGDGNVCRICGSENLTDIGFYYTNVSKFVSKRCDDCGTLNRSKDNVLTTEERKNLLR